MIIIVVLRLCEDNIGQTVCPTYQAICCWPLLSTSITWALVIISSSWHHRFLIVFIIFMMIFLQNWSCILLSSRIWQHTNAFASYKRQGQQIKASVLPGNHKFGQTEENTTLTLWNYIHDLHLQHTLCWTTQSISWASFITIIWVYQNWN